MGRRHLVLCSPSSMRWVITRPGDAGRWYLAYYYTWTPALTLALKYESEAEARTALAKAQPWLPAREYEQATIAGF